MKKRFIPVILILMLLVTSCALSSFAAGTDRTPRLKYSSEKIYRGGTVKNSLIGAAGKVTWKTSDKKVATVSKNGVIKGKGIGKCTVTAKCRGKSYKCRIRVVRRKPDFSAKIVDVSKTGSGKSYVKVRFSNYSGSTLTIRPKATYSDFTSVKYKLKTKGTKSIKIKGGKSRTVTFCNYGKNEIWNHAGRKDPDIFEFLGSVVRYSFAFDEKTYKAGTKWIESGYDEETGEYKYSVKSWYTDDGASVPTAK